MHEVAVGVPPLEPFLQLGVHDTYGVKLIPQRYPTQRKEKETINIETKSPKPCFDIFDRRNKYARIWSQLKYSNNRRKCLPVRLSIVLPPEQLNLPRSRRQTLNDAVYLVRFVRSCTNFGDDNVTVKSSVQLRRVALHPNLIQQILK